MAEKYQAYYHIVTSWIDSYSTGVAGFIGGMHLKWSADFFESAGKAGNAAIGAIKNDGSADRSPKNFAVMTENNPDGMGFGDGTEAGLKAAGYNVVTYEKFARRAARTSPRSS